MTVIFITIAVVAVVFAAAVFVLAWIQDRNN